MSHKYTLDDEEKALFRQSVGDIEPITQDTVLVHGSKPKPEASHRRADELQVLEDMINETADLADLETGDEIHYRGPGIQNQYFRKLRRGQFSIQDELDLHGLTVEQAKDVLQNFITKSKSSGFRCVRVIHGKGKGSRDGRPRLKNYVNRWLRLHKHVLAYCSARPADGGTGAVYVLIKIKS